MWYTKYDLDNDKVNGLNIFFHLLEKLSLIHV